MVEMIRKVWDWSVSLPQIVPPCVKCVRILCWSKSFSLVKDCCVRM